ncbi:fumarylacetoacetate hydrolase family protein [Acidithiobacillus sp. 'AMD consortium']|jgi:fumarylpyruvate hydrolase|uniref:Fumarylacetoacetate hydrolase family protein n=2 Tax=Acidithiobacillus ferridurans TaxID=1232575 RepID=A0A8X8GAK0_ACIFI|nr:MULTISPECIES: fumarylacetoacetate hydrolase family protein [Acidithiobacillus]MBU2716402.1 fumarylacetoacetate hydrolase family protein [Acidithiobacillus ferridurans]MBU2719072.1 fumarylacetoacetate hydrolase family protein [Acidithiobacillus ferridurans]MBU2723388.1 fumarylacetoacetate hydrolase family protein [Acidithiobacillus ferridurans]MBU2728237.1 fumarylacetoacetate hydrolase family protein [Acidithiobacillus ferridurans]MBU2733968.1 fumarylacetoacetate hydrolase family protein [Ac
MNYAFPPAPVVTLDAMSSNPFPVRRIFCVGQNYADHVREMGSAPDTEPLFFMKPASAILQNNSVLPYPPGTTDLQPEVELVVALHKGGKNIPMDKVDYDYVFGYAVGLDMTRRDLQRVAREKGQPWEMAKAFDHSAPCTAITPEFYSGTIARGKIELKVNGQIRQSADVGDMLWKIPQIVHFLSNQIELFPGDIIFTGTPAGVGPVVKGDVIEAAVAGLEPLTITIG